MEAAAAAAGGLPAAPRRQSIAKAPGRLALSPFERLPDEIIEQILLATDPNGFASLVLVNSKWRAVSQRQHLYLHHLERCPSYWSSRPDPLDDLPRLRRLFAREVKRNLFHAYLRPRCTVVKLISNSISSSSCPGGEGMQFAPSLRGHHVLAYNSSRIYVIDVRSRDLDVRRELKILRRPAAACVTDDATLLAVLSTEVQIDLYDLREAPPRRKNSLVLTKCPRTIALSSCGSVLVVAYDGGIEVSSLDPGALPTDRRAVKCDAVDALAFSLDGTQILGTTTHSPSPSTVVLTAPYYDPGSQLALADSNLSAMWTTSILFPNTSRDCSHAILLPRDGDHGEVEWTFTYDRSFETFRAVRLDDLRNGTTYFTGPVPSPASQSKLLPCTLPASTPRGELVAAGFRGSEVWVYGVPGDLDAVFSETGPAHDGPWNASGSGRHSGPQSGGGLSRHASSRGRDGECERVPPWQLLCDKLRNNFVAGCKVAELAGVSNVKWVGDFAGTASGERLVVTARGVSGPRLVTDEEDMGFMDGGRIALLDFEYGPVDGATTEVAIEVGTDEAEVLEEERRDMAAEVALVRRRTVAQRHGGLATARRPAATGLGAGGPGDAPPTGDADGDALAPMAMAGKGAAAQTAGGGDQASVEEQQEALDAPYAHASPRSGNTLRRAATAAAVNRRLNPRTADGRPIEYRRADGRAEHPHESDADNWVPPPPPYQEEDPGGDLPAFLRGPAVAPPPMPPLPAPPRHDGRIPASPSRAAPRAAEAETSPGHRRRSHPRISSVSTTSDRLRDGHLGRPRSSLSLGAVSLASDDIYGVSPPVSPCVSEPHLEGHQPHGYEAGGAPGSRVSAATASLGAHARRPSSPPSVSTHDVDGASVSTCSPAQAYLPLAHLDDTDLAAPGHHLPLDAAEPRQRRLSNAQTWPLWSSPSEATTSTWTGAGNDQVTQPRGTVCDGLEAAVQGSGELPSPLSRMSRDDARRPSTGIHNQQDLLVWDGSHAGGPYREPQREGGEEGWTDSPGLHMPDFDRPLIISTPRGVSGALDPPRRSTSGRRSATRILAPVPRRPRQDHLVHHRRSTSEQVETTQEDVMLREARSPGMRLRRLEALPVWLRRSPAASVRSPTGVSRRPSRAERSAARNMLDARQRGWVGKRKRTKGKAAATATATTTMATTQHTEEAEGGSRMGGRRRRRREASEGLDGGSSAGWMDESSPPAASKDKKCAVM